MIAALYCCRKDRDHALRLLQWIGELGGCKGHSLILSYSREVDTSGLHSDLVEEAQKHFDEVRMFVPDEDDERGWPMSANSAWRSMVYYVRHHIAKPWLWMEPDCVPRKPGWLDEIATEYAIAEKANKPFMGDEVTRPAHRLSGVAVYPARVVAYLTNRLLPQLDREAWDSYFAQDFTRHSQFTKLIQHVWLVRKDPDELMSFPDQASLAQLRPEAVLFHRCKSGDLIARLRERNPNAKPAEFTKEYERELVKNTTEQLAATQPEETKTASSEYVRSSRATALFGNGKPNGGVETVKDLVEKLVEHSRKDGLAKARIIKQLRDAGLIPVIEAEPVRKQKRRRAKARA